MRDCTTPGAGLVVAVTRRLPQDKPISPDGMPFLSIGPNHLEPVYWQTPNKTQFVLAKYGPDSFAQEPARAITDFSHLLLRPGGPVMKEAWRDFSRRTKYGS